MSNRVFVIAEAGVNHNGSVELAQRLIDAAVASGADAVKFQSFRADSLTSASAPLAAYQARNQPGEQSQLSMLRKLELGEDAQRRLHAHALSRGIEFMSTPFDLESLEFLVSGLGVARLKIGSGEITNGPLLLRAARSGLPLIVSTGMSTMQEVEDALDICAYGITCADEPRGAASFRGARDSLAGKRALAQSLTLLHCTSEYPAPIDELNLLAMDTLRAAFGVAVGLSDHSVGIVAAISAAARGAAVIEKHFTLDRKLPGPDHKASLEPAELTQMVIGVREATLSLGSPDKGPTRAELDTRAVARRSLVAARDLKEGETLSARDIAVKRPGGGVSPLQFWDWIGRPAARDYAKDDPL